MKRFAFLLLLAGCADDAPPCSTKPPGLECPAESCALDPRAPGCGQVCWQTQCYECLDDRWQAVFVDCPRNFLDAGDASAIDASLKDGASRDP